MNNMAFFDNVSFGDTLSMLVTQNYAEKYTISDPVTIRGDVGMSLSSNVHFSSFFEYILDLALNDSLDLTDDFDSFLELSILLTENIRLQDQSTFNFEVLQSIIEALTVNALWEYIATLDLSDTLTLADTIEQNANTLVLSEETLNLIDEIQHSIIFTFDESVTFTDNVTHNFNILLKLTDTLKYITSIRLGDKDYSAWVMNTATTGSTTYSNFPFNGLEVVDGVLWGVTDTGLYILNGDTDDGENIEYLLTSGELNFGTSYNKSCPRAYLYSKQTGDITLRTISTRRGIRTEHNYTITPKLTAEDMQLRSKRLGSGVKGTWWQIEIEGNSPNFETDGTELFIELRERSG